AAITGWWRQAIAVGYEQASGRRRVGQTAAGFQVGVQVSVAATAAEAWELITARPELWLGASVIFEKGQRYEVPGASGVVRVVRPGDRLRLTWQPKGWAAPATVQLTLLKSGSGKTAIHAHLEKLPDPEVRQAMRDRWRSAV